MDSAGVPIDQLLELAVARPSRATHDALACAVIEACRDAAAAHDHSICGLQDAFPCRCQVDPDFRQQELEIRDAYVTLGKRFAEIYSDIVSRDGAGPPGEPPEQLS